MKSKRVIIVLFIFLLATCKSEQTISVTKVPLPSISNTATKVPSSLSPTLFSPETLSPILESRASIPVATINAAATVSAVRVDLLNKFPELQDYFTFCSPGYCYGVQGSPNGQWIYLTNFWSLHIFNVNGERVGKYSFRDIYRHIADYCLGYIDGAHWSKDGRYLYVTINPCGNGGTESYFQYATAGVRVNLEDGDWSDVGCLGHSRFHQMMNI